MGKLRKIGSKWVVDFRLPRLLAQRYGVKRFRRFYAMKAKASEIHGLVAGAIADRDRFGVLAELLSQGDSGQTVQGFYDRWISEYCRPRLEASTVKRYELSFRTINDYCGGMLLKDFRRQHLHGYVQKRALEVSASTVNKDLIACKRMFSYAAEVGAIESNPLTRFPVLRVQEKARRIPTPAEFSALVKAMPDSAISAMVAIMGETGIRRSEAIELAWSHVDLRNHVIVLERTKGKRVRTVPLSQYAVSVLRALTRFVHTPTVFCHQVTGEPWKSPDKCFREGRKKAKLPWVTFHTLRHMRATRWMEEGHHPVQVQKWLGHRDITTTMIYEHYAKSSGTKAVHGKEGRL